MTIAQNLIVDALADLFRRAEDAAVHADPGDGFENDGGTCNMDTPAFRIDRMPKTVIEEAARRAGVSVCEFTWFGGRRWYWLNVTMNGQGNRRSKMMTAAQRVLNDACPDAGRVGIHSGFKACGYYQMD